MGVWRDTLHGASCVVRLYFLKTKRCGRLGNGEISLVINTDVTYAELLIVLKRGDSPTQVIAMDASETNKDERVNDSRCDF